MNKKLCKNLSIFSDGSFCLEFNAYNVKKIKYFIKDLKQEQQNIKKRLLNISSNLNTTTNYRKKLFQ